MKRNVLGTFIVISALALSGCSTFAGEVVTKFDTSGNVIEKSCKGFHVSLGESESECLVTEGITPTGAGLIGAVLNAVGKAVRLITPPILLSSSEE